MNFKTFSKLWDKYVTNRPKINDSRPVLVDSCSPETARALIKYGQGNKTKLEEVRKFLKEKHNDC